MKTLDFNAIQRPALTLTMKDDEHTVIRVTTPKTALIDRLVSGMTELEEILKKKEPNTLRAVYDLAAELMSNNLDFITVTGDELRDKYKLELDDMVVFFSVYLDFVHELQNAKN